MNPHPPDGGADERMGDDIPPAEATPIDVDEESSDDDGLPQPTTLVSRQGPAVNAEPELASIVQNQETVF